MAECALPGHNLRFCLLCMMQFPGSLGFGQGPLMQPGRGVCREFAQSGRCSYGNICKFSHDVLPGQGQQPNHNNASFQAARYSQHHEQQQQLQLMQQQQQQQQVMQARVPQSHSINLQQQQQQGPISPPAAGTPGPVPSAAATPGAGPGQQAGKPPAVPGQPLPQQQLLQGLMPPSGVRQPRNVTYLDRVRAVCSFLKIGHVEGLMTPEAMAATARAFQLKTAYKENPFADSIEPYISA